MGSTHTLTYAAYTVKALITFMQTSSLICSFWNKSINGRNLSCKTQDAICDHCTVNLSKL